MTPKVLDIDSRPQTYTALHGALDEPTADALLTHRELEIRSLTRDVVAREVAPRSADLDRSHEFAEASVQALARAGLMGLTFPVELGGSGDSNVAYAVAVEEVAAGCASTSLIFMTQMHAAYPIFAAGSSGLAERYIPGLLSGASYGSLAITEPHAGSDVSSMKSVAGPSSEGWQLSGSKTFITTGDRSDVIVCFASTDRSKGRDGVTAFVLEGRWEGISRGRPFDKLGMHASTTAELFFDNATIPRDNVLGGEGAGWQVVMNSVVKSRISAAAQGVGLARAAYAKTLALLTQIHGNRLPDEVTFTLADLRSRLLQGRLILHATARQVDSGYAVTPGHIGMMKQACTDLGFQSAVLAARLLGPYGDLQSVGVERCLRDAKVTQIYDGTNEIQRLLVGRETMRSMEGLS